LSKLRKLGYAAVTASVVAASGLAWLWPRLVWGEVEPRWVDPLPENAVDEGYGSFFRWRGGPAWPAYEESWLERDPPRPDGPLLVDRVHTSKQPYDEDLAMDAYGYSHMHGFARAFAPARAAGVDIEPMRWRWSGRRLAGASAVFMNLASGDNAALRTSEVVALEAFVRRGGGLVLITDHSNCYFHAELLLPLTRALGITLPPATAADPAPGHKLSEHTVSWIRVFAQSDHPVMAGVHELGWMTGGAVQGLTALATTSAESWYDKWEPYRKGDSSGFTGDLERQPDEEPGPVTVVGAGTHGAGRVVVLTDQNAFGATMIGYEDNQRLFTNALAWAMGRDLPIPTRDARSVTTLQGADSSHCTSVIPTGFRTFQVQVQRWGAKTGRSEWCTNGSPGESGGIVLLPGPVRDDLDALLRSDRRVLAVLDPAAAITDPVLAAFGLTRGPPDDRTSPATWTDPWPAPDVPQLEVGDDTIDAQPMPVTGPMQVRMADALGRPVVATVADGRVILVFDARLLGNGALGGERDDPRKKLEDGGSSRAMAAHRLAHRLLARLFGE
jgi:hypothetical protein